MLAPIGLVARKEDLVMRPLDGGDAVHLHEADIVDEPQQPLLAEKAIGARAQALPGEKDTPGLGVGEKNRHGG